MEYRRKVSGRRGLSHRKGGGQDVTPSRQTEKKGCKQEARLKRVTLQTVLGGCRKGGREKNLLTWEAKRTLASYLHKKTYRCVVGKGEGDLLSGDK